MWRQCTGFILLVVMLAGAAGGPAFGAFNPLKDPAIIGWWTCDEGVGTVVADSSPNGNNGAFINGDPAWTTGIYGNAITLVGPTLVRVEPMGLTLSQATMAGWLFAPAAQPEWASIIMHRGPGPASGFNLLADRQLAYHWNDASTTWSFRGNVQHPLNEWAHCAVTVEPSQATFYLNGVESAVNSVSHPSCAWDGPIWLGGDGGADWVARRMNGGSLDDVCFFSRALTADEIVAIMGGLSDPAKASAPTPGDAATDVPQDIALGWKAGETAATHNVYFGESVADVNDATQPVATGAATTYDPEGLLDFGKTYYWRIDEVEAGGGIITGDIWSFTVEPFAYPIADVTATASSFRPGMGPENTVNGSGMNADDQHSTEPTHMWVSAGTLPNWIQYEFDKAYKLEKMLVWNSNQMIEPFIGFGAKTVTVEVSTDGATWTAVEGVPEFGQASGAATYAANTVVDFGGAVAQYVKLTLEASFGGLPQTGLSEVRFFQIPVQAREPVPADEATDVVLNSEFNWRPGREATSHEVLFGTDPSALAAKTVAGHTYTPTGMEFGTMYYWQVNELGDAGAYAGDLWSLTSQEFAAIDDFESYTDDEGSRIYEYWIDGLTTEASGSQVGYDGAPFAEKTIVHGGKQSMPLAFDNTASPYYSEAELEFETQQNWTGAGASELAVWTQGYPAIQSVAVAETGGKMSVTGAGADIWGNSDEFTYAYKTLNGDGTLVARVTSNGTGTNAWAKGGAMIRDSLNGNSTHAMMVITAHTAAAAAGNGASFQYRTATGGASANTDSTIVVAPPYWVKIERIGDTLTGYTSANGTTWSMVNTAIITMADPVYIGLAVTSHAAGEDRTFEFDSIAATGNVTGAWQGAVINSAQYNPPTEMYLTVEDSTGKTAMAISATAANAAAWTRWVVPMSDLAGVNFARVKKLTIGVGSKTASTPGGAGMVFIDDVGYGRSMAQ